MDINQLREHLQSHDINPDIASNKVKGLTIGHSADLSAADAWALVEKNGLKAGESDTMPAEAPPEQSWGQFRLVMLNDESYKALVAKAITTTGGTLLVLRVESEIREQDTHLPSLVTMWKMLLNAVPLFLPSKVVIDRWNKFCSDSNMPFRFAADGAIVLL